jgi:hypothetical protein
MPTPKKPSNLKLTRQISCSLSEDSFERWHHLCIKNQCSSHELLRQVVEQYCKERMKSNSSAYTVLDALKG